MRRFEGQALALALALATSSALAEPGDALRSWSGNHALTLPRGRTELGLLQNAHYGLTDRLELALHPLWFWVLPHAELKVLAHRYGHGSWAARGRVAYPTLFLNLVSREGAGGLLPKTSSAPQALQLEGDVLGSWALGERHLASAALGLAVAPHGHFTPTELPLLDFPFLYPRFAPLYAVLVPRASLELEGHVWGGLFYDVSALGYVMPRLPDVGTAYALEQAASLELRNQRIAFSLGLRASEAKYAYGTRAHFLPFGDLRVGF